MTLLDLKGLETFYGASQALFGVDLDIREGEVVALMGRNGMGKTTTINSIIGLDPPALRRHQLCRQGDLRHAAVSHRETRPRPRAGGTALLSQPDGHGEPDRHGPWQRADLRQGRRSLPRLGERRHQYAKTLSGGEQQMLAIGRALLTNPRLLILDEATEGLAPVIRQDIRSAIRKLKAAGQSILVVDKTLSELLPRRGPMLRAGEGHGGFEGAPTALTSELQDRYLGV
ncbi:ABC transporter ATP-binding protein [Sinorhizobium medicae]|uniref:ABC transporter ATP-binding protein n=1 Tax=Sinorhizobium medicae TaxID=110321 RepID=UPI003091267B|nr:ATP-binding cassette domain-containing protein [Sinorhizobium medicae]